MARASHVVLALVAALVTLAAAQSQCTYRDVIRHSGPCSASVDCTAEMFCSRRESVCMPRIEIGGDCTRETSGCVEGSTCRGTAESRVCVANAGAGGDCSISSGSTLPRCGGHLSCSSYVCVGGSIFDSCLRNEDCASNICQNNECKPKPKAASCQPFMVGEAQQCELDSTCSSLSGTCVARGSTGTFCREDTDCQLGHSCLQADDMSGNGTCVEWFALAPGERCTSGAQCAETLRCFNGRCAAKRAVFCSSNSDCSVDEWCTCEGAELRSGVGVCTSWKCAKAREAFMRCLDENCGGDLEVQSGLYLYEGSCALRFCESELKADLECSGAASLIASVLAAFGIALFVSKATSA